MKAQAAGSTHRTASANNRITINITVNSSTIGAERELRLVYKPVVYRVQRQLKAVGDAKLIKNIVQMIFYGCLGNENFFPVFLNGKAFCNELHISFLFLLDHRFFGSRLCSSS